ncbi:hypothetical protein Sgly_2189 [Syntrophobotulus glycolicus DSM 8271]|uniref:Uncharacterized protein n=1 Tax=Syntrophobotulus glycolicus (strain DSM 8271 / FlGlyR) TaxID=645991 RepID=F0T2S9_SYNGF|nr:hypothetical protein Sgly_2189 [Syntrophobotulus glycolicus DSM 8271]
MAAGRVCSTVQIVVKIRNYAWHQSQKKKTDVIEQRSNSLDYGAEKAPLFYLWKKRYFDNCIIQNLNMIKKILRQD